MSMRVVIAGVVLLTIIAGALGACANTQPGDRTTGPDVALERPDLAVKLQALRGDPCGGARVATIYPGCGRYVTEVANIVGTLRDDLPGEVVTISELNDAVSIYQRLGCETVIGPATSDQATRCPEALTTIGSALNALAGALARQPTG